MSVGLPVVASDIGGLRNSLTAAGGLADAGR